MCGGGGRGSRKGRGGGPARGVAEQKKVLSFLFAFNFPSLLPLLLLLLDCS